MSDHAKIMGGAAGDLGPKCLCGAELNWLALLIVKEPKNGKVELVLSCPCDQLYSAFLSLDENQMPLETVEEA